MTILYALIARGKTVLAEYTFTSGNFPTITRLLLGKIQLDRDGKMSYVYDQYIFHYVCHDHILYLCMCDDPTSSKRRVPFNFLEDIRQRFVATYGDQAQTAIAFAMNHEFGPVLQTQMELFNSPSADSSFSFAPASRKKSPLVLLLDAAPKRQATSLRAPQARPGPHQARRGQGRHGAEHRDGPRARREARAPRRQDRPAQRDGLYVREVEPQAQGGHVLEEGQDLPPHHLRPLRPPLRLPRSHLRPGL
mmetsp:Transcript_15700/g.63227  ORF Transcript_15700/g.63227 Transcript_15700/m.63227 type:complete len:249 (+) Transcript_15700:257-1003(+)